VHSADKEQRFPLLKLEQLNDQQRPLADEILKVASIGISGPFNMMLRSPVMASACLPCSITCVSTLPSRAS